MMSIGATVSGFERLLLNELANADAAAVMNAIRLSTGKKINRPSDDPSAFLEISTLETRLSNVNSTLDQVNTAANAAAQAQLTLDQIRTKLNTIRTSLLADEDQSLTSAQRDEKQATIDAAIEQINTLASTEIAGRRWLDGSMNFRISGRSSAQINNVQVISAADTTIRGSVISAATQAALTYTGAGGAIVNDATFTLTGERGSTTFTVSASDPLTGVRDDLNEASHKTGITASVAGDVLSFTTVDFGADANIDIEVTSGTFNVVGGNGDGTAEGVDAVAKINDVTLESNNVDGNRVTFNQNGLHVIIEFAAGFTGVFDNLSISDENASKFVLSPNLDDVASLGVPGVQAAQFRGLSGSLDQLESGGSLAGLGTNTSQAMRVVDEALDRLTSIEGRVDAFADVTIATSSALLTDFKTNSEEYLEDINDVDVDEESLLLAKNQALASNAVASLSILQQQHSAVLQIVKLLGGIT